MVGIWARAISNMPTGVCVSPLPQVMAAFTNLAISGAAAAEQAEPSAGHGQFRACAGTAQHGRSGRRPYRADRQRESGSRDQQGSAVRRLAGIGAPSPAGLCSEWP